MNLEVLNQSFEVKENPGLDTTDPRLDEISTLVQQAQYLEAATQAESLLAEGICDIRIVGFFAYGVFLEQGMGALTNIFLSFTALLRDNWEAFGPVIKREKHAQTSFRWFVTQLLKKVQYEESRQSDLWQAWTTSVSSDDVQEMLDAADEFRKVMATTLEEASSQVIDSLAKTVKWLQSFQQLVYREPEPEPVPEAAEEEEPYAAEDDSVEEPSEDVSSSSFSPSYPDSDREYPSPRTQDRAPLPRPTTPVEEGALMVEGSYHLGVLMKKMEAFERLVSEGKFPRASLVADDINEIIASFDPKVFFPKLFSRFSFLQALNIGDLTSFEEHKQTVEWQALKEFYRVDLDGFVNF